MIQASTDVDSYEQLLARVRDVGRLNTVLALLDWDYETYMPIKGESARAEQIALLSGLSHEMFVSDGTGALLERAERECGDELCTANLREIRRDFDRNAKLPTALVKETAHASTLSKGAWAKARTQDDFSLFASHLARMIELKQQAAEHVGYETEPYDALMDEFEPGARAQQVEQVFAALREKTVALLARLDDAADKPDVAFLSRTYPVDRQRELSVYLCDVLGYDTSAGRTDTARHPFCTTIGGSGDVRVTTRYNDRYLPASFFSLMHEIGHALYEQGLDPAHRFTPLGDSISLGIHESQSRLWENIVGRSRSFWEAHFPVLTKLFAEPLSGISAEDFYRAVNVVQPSLIRVEADEVTYNLHIILRFNLEREMISGRLSVADIPAAWNEGMKDLLGIVPPSSADGCLQDIHWSLGTFGYFPTYTLGNLYAAQFFQQAVRDIDGLWDQIRSNNAQPLLDWLRENIHRHGRRYRAGELVERVTGESLSIEPLIDYTTAKVNDVYRL